MPRPGKRERFIASKCDRCGKTTPAKQNGTGDLYVLPVEYGEPLADRGCFCLTCLGKYNKQEWLEWFKLKGLIDLGKDNIELQEI